MEIGIVGLSRVGSAMPEWLMSLGQDLGPVNHYHMSATEAILAQG